MNEVSNGISGSGGGSQEYVEFVVASNTAAYSCNSTTPPCIDIRGWIFDDNSGYHGSSGIAAGAVRFSQNILWSCLPLGTIILIYNDADKNPAIPTLDDLSLTDGNCTIIVGISNTTLFDRNSTTPGAAACSYPTTGWVAGGTWANTALANASDCARIVNLAGCEVFSVCYGAANNSNNLIYFSGSGTGNVYFFNGINPQLQTNWSVGSSTAMQTPGAPNNATNAAYIAQFNNNCTPITTLSVSSTSVVNAGCTCNGSATMNASGSIGNYTYVWYDSNMNPIGKTSATATGLCAGVYNVIATSHIGCTATVSVTISSTSTASVSVNSQTVCAGSSALLTATSSSLGGTFLWAPGGQTTSTISVSPNSTTTYSVTYTLAGCTASNTSTVTVKPLPNVTVNSPAICNGESALLTAHGAASYVWHTGINTSTLSVSPASNANFTVIGTSNGCTHTAISNVTVNTLPAITVNSSTLCAGQTATLIASGATSYTWNNGSTANPLIISPTSNSNYTVVGSANGCSNTAFSSIIVNSVPIITANSATVCAGQTTTLTANGANSYIWNTGATTSSITDNPLTTTIYSVSGNLSGCITTTTAVITVKSNLPISVNNPVICSGQTATLTANGSLAYIWSNGASGNSIVVSPINTSTFSVTGTNGSCTGSAVATVSVNPLPSIYINSFAICAGQAATLIASGATSYTWNTGSTANPLIISPTSNSNYTVIGSANGCSNTAVSSITVNSAPVITVSSATICAGQTATLTANGANTYTWSTGTTINSLSVSPTVNSIYTVSGTLSGCTATQTAFVTVISSPIITINSASICAGETATLTASGAGTYLWGNGTLTNTISVSPLVTTTYSVTGTLGACTGSASVNVSVDRAPVLSVLNQTICAGSTTTLTANGATTYSWSTGSISNPLITAPVSTTVYTLTGSNFGCSGSITVTVNVIASPNIIFDSNVLNGCAPLCVQFSDSTRIAGDVITNWNWEFNGSPSDQQNPFYCFTNAGLYDVSLSVTSSNGCTKKMVKSNMIHVFPNPIAEFVTNPQTTDLFNPTVEFTNQSLNSTTYLWYFGDTTSSTQINPSHTYNQAGAYSTTLAATNQYGCKNITVHDIIVSDVFTFYAPNAFTPNEDNVNDTFIPLGVGWDKNKYQFEIFDRWGNRCFSTTDVSTGWNGKVNNGKETAQIDTYTWKVELNDIYGVKHKFVGKVIILK